MYYIQIFTKVKQNRKPRHLAGFCLFPGMMLPGFFRGHGKEIVIDLEKGEMITASFETKEMSKKEMEEAGIDTTENKAIFEYTVNLEFESKV